MKQEIKTHIDYWDFNEHFIKRRIPYIDDNKHLGYIDHISKPHGLFEYWEENGKKFYEHPYKNGLSHGFNKCWHGDKSIWFLKVYKNNLPHGIKVWFDYYQ